MSVFSCMYIFVLLFVVNKDQSSIKQITLRDLRTVIPARAHYSAQAVSRWAAADTNQPVRHAAVKALAKCGKVDVVKYRPQIQCPVVTWPHLPRGFKPLLTTLMVTTSNVPSLFRRRQM